MKVLYVDQFGKTAGRDSLAQCECVSKYDDMDVTVYLSDNTEIPDNKKFASNIQLGFHGAYEGSAINKATNYIKALVELRKYIKKEKFDIIHLQWFSLPWIEWLYVHSIKKYGKIVITVHDVIPFNNRPFEMKCLNMIYKCADRLLLHTKSSKEEFEANYTARTPISIITQGFCLKSDYQKIDKKEAKKHFGISEDSVVYLYYGTIRKSKGLNHLIKAIGKAHMQNKKVYLLAAGAFQKIDPEEYKQLVAENLDDSSCTTNFNFIPMEDEPWYFSAADVLCLPYLEITQSGVAQVGLMYDLPMISSDIGEMGEVTRQGENGELVKPGDEDSLMQAILKVADDEKLRNLYSLKSKQLGEEEFSVEIKAKKVVEAYRLLSGK